MKLEQAIAKREQLKKKAQELDAWLKVQHFQSDEDRRHHLSMPEYPDVHSKFREIVEEIWDEHYKLDEKIKKVTADLVIQD
ncbi:hypothetical protein [Exiguobacterium sp. s163]|uniref:hypothetical protein n=1 Tax=Exiguobacterium sp. s163 TaxID=2751287 RepID=UPI001BE53EDC|nr:hypothetical protein [Exiguobacterium sp. s163]